MAELLRVENVTRRFGGLLALDRASLVAEDGQIATTEVGTGFGPVDRGCFVLPQSRRLIGVAGDDTVSVAAGASIGRSVMAVLGNGDNSVSIAGDVSREVSVVAGSGDDKVEVTAEREATFSPLVSAVARRGGEVLGGVRETYGACRHCHYKTERDWRYCPMCGERLER